MINLNADVVRDFLVRLGQRYDEPANLYLVGGAALCLLGSLRPTLDLDYVGSDIRKDALQQAIDALATEMQLDVEAVPLEQMIPLPAGAEQRSQLIGQFGSITASIFDPYSIAFSKLARGFDTDIDDVVFLLRHGLLTLAQLESVVNHGMRDGQKFDIMPSELRNNWRALQQRLSRAQ
jgi:hypothetical protein